MDLVHLVLIFVMVALMVIAVIIAIAVCVAVLFLLIAGAVSSSVLIGLWKRRALAGVRALLIQMGLITGVPLGAIGALILSRLWPAISQDVSVLVLGGAGGAVVGLIAALLADAAFHQAARHLPKLRLPRTTIKTVLT